MNIIATKEYTDFQDLLMPQDIYIELVSMNADELRMIAFTLIEDKIRLIGEPNFRKKYNSMKDSLKPKKTKAGESIIK